LTWLESVSTPTPFAGLTSVPAVEDCRPTSPTPTPTNRTDWTDWTCLDLPTSDWVGQLYHQLSEVGFLEVPDIWGTKEVKGHKMRKLARTRMNDAIFHISHFEKNLGFIEICRAGQKLRLEMGSHLVYLAFAKSSQGLLPQSTHIRTISKGSWENFLGPQLRTK